MAKQQRKRIFLVDDDGNHSLMLRTTIEKKFDMEVITFNNGEDCIKNLHLNPDFVLLNYYFSSTKEDSINGTGVLKQIKMITPRVYVIMLSAEDRMEELVDALKYGAYDYVIKNQSSFLRVENILNHISNNMALEKKSAFYKKGMVVLSVLVLLLVTVLIILARNKTAATGL